MSVIHDNEASIGEVGNNGSRIDELFHFLNQKAASLGCGISPDVILAETIGDMAPGLQLQSGPDGTSIVPVPDIATLEIKPLVDNALPSLEGQRLGITLIGGDVFDAGSSEKQRE